MDTQENVSIEIKLTDNSKLSLTRLADDRLRLKLYQPKTLRDGYGFTLVGYAILEGEALTSLLPDPTSSQRGHEVRHQ